MSSPLSYSTPSQNGNRQSTALYTCSIDAAAACNSLKVDGRSRPKRVRNISATLAVDAAPLHHSVVLICQSAPLAHLLSPSSFPPTAILLCVPSARGGTLFPHHLITSLHHHTHGPQLSTTPISVTTRFGFRIHPPVHPSTYAAHSLEYTYSAYVLETAPPPCCCSLLIFALRLLSIYRFTFMPEQLY